MSSSPSVMRIKPPNALSTEAYSHVISVAADARVIYTAGVVGTSPDAKHTPTEFVAQVELAYMNLKNVLAAAGASPADVVKLNLYIVSLDDAKVAAHAQGRKAFYAGSPPGVATLVGVEKLVIPEYLFEVDAVAVISG